MRGIGVVDMQKLFGMSGVKSATQIDLVIQFERWQDEKFYDRLGLDEAHTRDHGRAHPALDHSGLGRAATSPVSWSWR